MDLKETDILGTDIGAHWYYASKAKAMMRMIGNKEPKKILDIGAGSGFFSRYILSHTSSSEAWCVDIGYKSDSDNIENGKSVHYRCSVNSIDADLVLLMDVLEHVDDDIELLKDYVSKVPSGSHFLISVPAFQFLWSGHDEFLEHKRRYTLKQLDAVVQSAGLKVKSQAYYFGMVFPVAVLVRLKQKLQNKIFGSSMTKHHPLINSILKMICNIELPFMQFNQLAGLTVFCLAEKP